MKRLFLAAAGLATVLGLALLLRPDIGRAQVPGNPEPFAVPVSQPTAGQGSSVMEAIGKPPAPPPALPTTPGYGQLPTTPAPGGPAAPGTSAKSGQLQEYVNESLEAVKINDAVAVQPACGEWMICINWYSGPNAPKLANILCQHLRGPKYNLPAFVFTKGLEERKQELERVAKFVEMQRQALINAKLSADVPIHVPLTRYEIECAVLVGGYKDMDTARRALEGIKKLKAPDPRDVPLHWQYFVECDKTGKANKSNILETPANPFATSMVVHNPTLPMHADKQQEEEDMRLLRALNEEEPYSLLKCPHKYTLTVKQFSLPLEIKSRDKADNVGFLDKINLNPFSKKEDAAAISAHNLAELLRRAKLEAYVLHTRFCSYVCVGGYDDTESDRRRMLLDQERLPQLNGQLHQEIQLAARPAPTAVPGR
jgi:hypothetical protein